MKRIAFIVFLLILTSHIKANFIVLQGETLSLKVNPLTFQITLIKGDENYLISSAIPGSNYNILKKEKNELKIKRKEADIELEVQLSGDVVDVTVRSDRNEKFEWPVLDDFNALTIPFHQGKYIPAKDPAWVKFLSGRSRSGVQDLSMQFFAANYENDALVFIIKNMFNNELVFNNNEEQLELVFEHEFPATQELSEYGFQIHLVDNSAMSIAQTYKDYVIKHDGIISLDKKAHENPNITKLYGAPHIYLWGSEFIDLSNINLIGLRDFWKTELNEKGINPTKHLFNLFKKGEIESGKELLNEWKNISAPKSLYSYHKNLLLRCINEVLASGDFYSFEAWSNIKLDKKTPLFINQDQSLLSETDLFQRNKYLFYSAFSVFVDDVEDWGNGVSDFMLNELKEAGINHAWLGVNDWVPAFIHPGFVQKANDLDYLIAPYDSYHSIHKPGKARWITAEFKDTTLYEKATICRKNGTKKTGFLGQGRKLNPTLSMPSVQNRVNWILDQGINFNSWFVDVDGTGEFHDDFTPGRMTSQKDDMLGRLERMRWICDDKKQVMGTEVGNDFCSKVIAFAHGMTTPVIEFGDRDMRRNTDSEYYIGSYFTISGGVPSRYIKESKIKEEYEYVYLDERFNLPLFQLVYNNSVITSHHWEWGTLKVPEWTATRELKEILYNVPPLYHLDRSAWRKYKDKIVDHVQVFSPLHARAVKMEMLSFECMSPDRNIQQTKFGDNKEVKIELTANFSKQPFMYKQNLIPAEALMINDVENGNVEIYQPKN